MKSVVLTKQDSPLKIEDHDSLEPSDGQVIVSLKASALNRRDYWITQGLYPGIQYPAVLGSDGAGVVSRIGANVDESMIGLDVLINPGLNWGNNQSYQSSDFQILGMPGFGTLASEVLVPAENVCPKPEHLSWSEAAALPLAGLTAFRALMKQGLAKTGDTVLITGIGGGVATFAMTFALAIGMKVLVTSSSDEKLSKARSLGAAAGYNYGTDDWGKQLKSEHGMPNLIVDGAGGAGYGVLLNLASPGGTIVSYGSTAGAPGKVDLFKVFWKQLRLIGSTMGSANDFDEMLDLVSRHNLRPVIDCQFEMENITDAFEYMAESRQFGKIVVNHPV